MVQWVKIRDNLWNVIYEDGIKKIDSDYKLIAFSLLLDIDINEIETALLELLKNDHNFAEFGIFKKLTFTKRMDV